jgi:glycosyltransferase involved in cell wall biosynthesis
LHKLAEVVPDGLKDQELLLDFKWRYTKPKVWSDKSVVFFCSHAFEDWGPESLLKGCGGSEEAVIQLTKRLVKLGWDVTVYNNCITEGVIDGVNWVRFERFNPRDMFNIIVSWRNNLFVDECIARQKYVDLHDVPEEKYYDDESTENVKIFVKSQYHRSLLPNVADEKFVIVPNGIDTKQFEKGPEKVRNNMVWTSSYDRGLDKLLAMWPAIKNEVPDATLDVYYGFELFDTTPWGRSEKGRTWKAMMQSLLAQDGIVDHGRVGSDEVAKAYMKADVWAYPTDFPEIDCITATKAMAAGAIPVTTDYAALKERNQGVMVKSTDALDVFKDELISLLKDDARKAELREKIDVSNYDWNTVASRWNEVFNG